ncbi:MAG: hypothetical protein JSR21_03080 [Proteobacteria bacterium]|nr:hypothetical protein [Pseudomonadota bacterium]
MSETASDKHYWHRYTDTYEAAFARLGAVREIFEFGVFRGGSIAWLARRFPDARIVGADIVEPLPEWPRDPRISYERIDQGDRAGVQAMFARLGRRYDLLIEDGSHLPAHQAACLTDGLTWVRPGGLYVLEDIHTSHPANAAFAEHQAGGAPNALHVLLAIRHLKDRGRAMTPAIAARLAAPGFFAADEIVALSARIAALDLYRRSILPLWCYACGGDDFDYAALRCACGADLYNVADSMSFLLTRA